MRGKVGLVIGLGVGYVLGTRAGRQRYEQIKDGAQKLWNLDPVQEQVGKAKKLASDERDEAPEDRVGRRGEDRQDGRRLPQRRRVRSSTPRSIRRRSPVDKAKKAVDD